MKKDTKLKKAKIQGSLNPAQKIQPGSDSPKKAQVNTNPVAKTHPVTKAHPVAKTQTAPKNTAKTASSNSKEQ